MGVNLSAERKDDEAAVLVKEIKDFRLATGEYSGIPAPIPSSVVSALVSAKIIADPYYGMNREEYLALLPIDAVFSAEFELDAVTMTKEHIMLRIGGIDAPAVLMVNGEPVARIENASVPYTLSVKQYLKVGKNGIEFRFDKREGSSADYITDIAIYEPVELVCYSKGVIDTVKVTQTHKDGKVGIDVSLTTLGADDQCHAVATLVSPAGSMSYSAFSSGVATMTVTSPNLWWPGRMGAHNLYRLSVNLYWGTELVDSREIMIGLRDIVLSDIDGIDRLIVNGEKFFPIGATYGEQEPIKPYVTEERMRLMLERAACSGIDAVYLRGLNAYPPEYFFDICDELGIFVFMDIVSKLNTDTAALRKIARIEVARALVRYSTHPSLALVFATADLGDVISDVAENCLTSAIYSSASVLPVIEGVPSLPVAMTVRTFLPESEMNIFSPSAIVRGVANMPELFAMIYEGYLMPHGFDEFIYLSAIISAQKVERAVMSARMSMSGIGCIFECLSDGLPTFSPSMLDYYSRPKALWYRSSHFAQPVRVIADADGMRVKFYISNLQRNVYIGKLSYSVMDNENREILTKHIPATAEPFTVAMVYECDLSEVIDQHICEYYLSYHITGSEFVSCADTCLFTSARNFELKRPDFTWEIIGTGKDYTLTIASSVYARAVDIYFDGEETVLEDNYFDITSSAPIRLKVTSLRPTAVESLRHKLRIRSLYDIGRNNALDYLFGKDI